ncbi:hypothetical protein [Streptomyces sp. NPDC001903]|uniref:hypothetical protein n=1 Tax=Streptomyces sp. NPDC001903 TaxID=3364622 RepID=UPI0036912E57
MVFESQGALAVGTALDHARLGQCAQSGGEAIAGGAGVADAWAATLDTGSAYAASLLPGMLLTGLGVGMTFPVLTGVSAAALPPARFATGSAITSMGRQIGAVLGVAVLVGILGTPAPGHAVAAFRHGWYAVAAAALLAACATLPLVRKPRPGTIAVAAANTTDSAEAADASQAGAA